MAMCLLSTLEPKIWTDSNGFNRHQLSCRESLVHERDSEMGCDSVIPQELRVLVVDDEHDTADSFAWLVGQWGHVASLAYNGIQALKSAEAHRPDVVLLDIEMPFMDGCEVARQLRVDVPRDECFIIAITGRADHTRRQNCIEAGIDIVLIKPVVPSVVETLLQLECIRAHRLRSRLEFTNGRGFSTIEGFRPSLWRGDNKKPKSEEIES